MLLFVHADARLPGRARAAIADALQDPEVGGGTFRLRFEPGGVWSSIFSSLDDHRRRRLGIFYGDAGLFVRRSVYEAIGGFEPIPLMEDYRFGQKLRAHTTVVYLRDVPIRVSDRRFRAAPLRTIAVWAVIQGLHTAGVSPQRLARIYRDLR